MISLTRLLVRGLQKIAQWRSKRPAHLLLGERGETEAFFYLESLGYQFVAMNFRAPYHRGEIDLIAWDKGTLCFIEVKTRSDDSFAPPSTAVTPSKQEHIRAVARRYLRRLPGERRPHSRFDIVSVVCPAGGGSPKFRLQKGAFTWDTGTSRRRWYRDYTDRHYWRGRR